MPAFFPMSGSVRYSMLLPLTISRLGGAGGGANSNRTDPVIMMHFSAMAKRGQTAAIGSEWCIYTRRTCTISQTPSPGASQGGTSRQSTSMTPAIVSPALTVLPAFFPMSGSVRQSMLLPLTFVQTVPAATTVVC
ncbi:unnamed protein product [Prorocentrum cordatum]|uniref:Uncharacterized protein n=1 Tax=Prorocentrum cordatum TaxID=2364126 RepID=A0ABN9VSU3_9DINO|nr:unnamed protein product [Polarella glacialis]